MDINYLTSQVSINTGLIFSNSKLQSVEKNQIDPANDQTFKEVILINNSLYFIGTTNEQSTPQILVVKTNKAGEIDEEFGIHGKIFLTISSLSSISVESAVKDSLNNIFIIGNGSDGDQKGFVLKINNKGIIDKSFGGNGNGFALSTYLPEQEELHSIDIDDNGNLILAGGSLVSGTYDYYFLKLNSQGIPDNSFGTSGKVKIDQNLNPVELIQKVKFDNNQKIVAVGYVYDGNYNQSTILRLNQDGTIDNTFGSSGINILDLGSGISSNLIDIKFDSNLKIIAVGDDSDDILAVKFNTDGTLDTNFANLGVYTCQKAEANHAKSFVLDNDDNLYIAGWLSNGSTNGLITKILSNGSLDTNFSNNGFLEFNMTDFSEHDANEELHSIIIDNNQTIYTVGFSDINPNGNGRSKDFLSLSISKDGVYNNLFNNDGVLLEEFGNASLDQLKVSKQLNNGKFIIAGHTYSASNRNDIWIRRLNQDGSIDLSFGTNGDTKIDIDSGSDDYLSTLEIDSEDRIVIGGLVDNDVFLFRLTKDGAADSSFGVNGSMIVDVNPGTVENLSSLQIHTQSNNIYFIGNIVTDSHAYIAKANANGTLDTNYGTNGIIIFNSNNTHFYDLIFDKNMNLIIAGSLSNNGLIMSLDLNGSPVNDFGNAGQLLITNQTGAATYSNVLNTVDISNTGYIVAAGYFSSDNNSDSTLIVKTSSNGQMITSFGNNGVFTNPNLTDEERVNTVKVTENGSIIASGFTSSTKVEAYIFKLNENGNFDTSFANNGELKYSFLPNQTNSEVVDTVITNKFILSSSIDSDIGLSAITVINLDGTITSN